MSVSSGGDKRTRILEVTPALAVWTRRMSIDMFCDSPSSGLSTVVLAYSGRHKLDRKLDNKNRVAVYQVSIRADLGRPIPCMWSELSRFRATSESPEISNHRPPDRNRFKGRRSGAETQTNKYNLTCWRGVSSAEGLLEDDSSSASDPSRITAAIRFDDLASRFSDG